MEALTRALSHPQHPTETMADALEGLLGPEEVLLVARTQRLPDDHVTAWDLPHGSGRGG